MNEHWRKQLTNTVRQAQSRTQLLFLPQDDPIQAILIPTSLRPSSSLDGPRGVLAYASDEDEAQAKYQVSSWGTWGCEASCADVPVGGSMWGGLGRTDPAQKKASLNENLGLQKDNNAWTCFSEILRTRF